MLDDKTYREWQNLTSAQTRDKTFLVSTAREGDPMGNDFLSDSEARRIQEKFKIPVDCHKPATYWIVALDRESFMPTDKELRQIRSYCEFGVRRLYNETWQRRMLEEEPLAKCGGHNTLIFRNGLRSLGFRTERPAGEWFYRRWSWESGPTYVPFVLDSDYRPHTLLEVLTRIEKDVPDRWEKWKQEHPDLFS